MKHYFIISRFIEKYEDIFLISLVILFLYYVHKTTLVFETSPKIKSFKSTTITADHQFAPLIGIYIVIIGTYCHKDGKNFKVEQEVRYM